MSRGLGCGSPECSNEKGEEGQPGEIESKELSILPLHPGWSRCPSSDPVYTRLSPGGLGEVFNKIRRAGKRGRGTTPGFRTRYPCPSSTKVYPAQLLVQVQVIRRLRPVQAPTQHPQTPASPYRSGTAPSPDSPAATSTHAAL